jgi:predicted SnoaL-like aldol condensation-catalyzing enzyme
MSITSNKDKVVAVLQSIETGDPLAFSYIHPDKYIQHNLTLADGIQGIGAVVGSQPVGTFKAKVVRAFEDGDFVVAHTEYDFFGPKVGFDVFRFEAGLIVEHWDNLRNQTPANGSGRSQTDGPTEVVDREKTIENKRIVREFVTENWFLGQDSCGRFTRNDVYVQHNPDGADGVQNFRTTMLRLRKIGITMQFTQIHQILGEGNFVLAMSEGLFGAGGGQPTAFYDLFRLEDGLIVEHWDVIEPILPRDQWKNGNGKF